MMVEFLGKMVIKQEGGAYDREEPVFSESKGMDGAAGQGRGG